MDLFHYWYTPMLAAKGTQQYPSEWYPTDLVGIGGSKHTQPLLFYSFELFSSSTDGCPGSLRGKVGLRIGRTRA